MADDSPEELQTAQTIEDRLSKGFEQAEGTPLRSTPKAEPKAAPDDATDEPDKATDSPDGDGLEEVEFDGETYRLPAKLKEAFIHKADYTQKTQGVAEKERAIAVQSEQIRLHQLERDFEQTVAEPMNNLSLIESRTKLLLANWQTLSPDEKQEILYLDKQKEQISKEIDAKRGEFNNGMQKAIGELRAKAADAVKKAIPGWSDATAKDVTEHALSEGYSNQELSSITDPRHMKTLWKAQQYDKLKAQAKATPPKVTLVKPGAPKQMPQGVKDNFNFKKDMRQASSPSQKARLIEEKLTREFSRR